LPDSSLEVQDPPNPDQLRPACSVFAQWLSRRRTLIGLLRRPGTERHQLARRFAAALNINHVLPDRLLHGLLNRRMLFGLLRRSPATAAGIADAILQRSLPDDGRRLPPASFRAVNGKLDAARENILLVVHQTTRTGAPVLGWNIARHLAERYNIFTITLGGGPLLQDFEALSVETHGPFGYASINPATIDHGLLRLFETHEFKYAIINSCESRALIEPCAARAIPTVLLLHEFATTVYQRDELRAAFDLASEIVFPAALVAQSSFEVHPILRGRPTRILPQGMSVLPGTGKTAPANLPPILAALAAARAQGAIIVLGAGSVELRKGVDLFLATAMRVCRAGANIRFLWVGHGYRPDEDMAYSIYLREQIARSGLQDRMHFQEQVPDLEPFYALADMFFLSSRLDPMPNVTIDAAHRGIPIICFDQASGMADVLKAAPLTAAGIADYLDTAMAADLILAYARDRDALAQAGAATRALAADVFDMAKYVAALDALGAQAAAGKAAAGQAEPLRSSQPMPARP
jgi:glycosyltransferase involved in cell wall biosynthesis